MYSLIIFSVKQWGETMNKKGNIQKKETKSQNIMSKIELETEITELLSELNDTISDKELLEWAKNNHPAFKERVQIENEIELKYSELERLK